LLVESAEDGKVVGTYRLMSAAMARDGGFYSESEFDFGTLDPSVLERAVEVGRACVAQGHRTGRVVHLLWRGLLRYLVWNDKQYLFGCCSVPTLDPAVGHRIARDLEAQKAWHPTLRAEPLPALVAPPVPPAVEEAPIPPLFQSYLGLGAVVLGGPAVDRAFHVTDFLVLLDLDKVDPRVRRAFERVEWVEQGEA
jgi:putative hemolysin